MSVQQTTQLQPPKLSYFRLAFVERPTLWLMKFARKIPSFPLSASDVKEIRATVYFQMGVHRLLAEKLPEASVFFKKAAQSNVYLVDVWNEPTKKRIQSEADEWALVSSEMREKLEGLLQKHSKKFGTEEFRSYFYELADVYASVHLSSLEAGKLLESIGNKSGAAAEYENAIKDIEQALEIRRGYGDEGSRGKKIQALVEKQDAITPHLETLKQEVQEIHDRSPLLTTDSSC